MSRLHWAPKCFPTTIIYFSHFLIPVIIRPLFVSVSQQSRESLPTRLPPLCFSCLYHLGIHSQQCSILATLQSIPPTSPVAYYLLPRLFKRTTAGSQNRISCMSVKRQGCQVSPLLNPNRGKPDWSLKISQGGWVLSFAKAQYTSTAVKVSVCLLRCGDVTSGTIQSSKRETGFPWINEEGI